MLTECLLEWSLGSFGVAFVNGYWFRRYLA